MVLLTAAEEISKIDSSKMSCEGVLKWRHCLSFQPDVPRRYTGLEGLRQWLFPK